MHELSIVKDIFDTIIENYDAKINDLSKIEITAGLLSNVQPVLIKNAFAAFIKEHPNYKDIELEVKVNEIEAFCEKCSKSFVVKYHKFVCDTCLQPSSTIVKGMELYISQVIFKNNNR